jgi:hypothetical protein
VGELTNALKQKQMWADSLVVFMAGESKHIAVVCIRCVVCFIRFYRCSNLFMRASPARMPLDASPHASVSFIKTTAAPFISQDPAITTPSEVVNSAISREASGLM